MSFNESRPDEIGFSLESLLGISGNPIRSLDSGSVWTMKSPSHPRHSELQVMLEPARNDLVRAFVREAALAEGVPVSCASLIADDCADVWLALSGGASGQDRAHIALSFSRRDVKARIMLSGHSRFAKVVASLGGRLRPDAGISCRESGIDGWEVSLHRSLTAMARNARPGRGGRARNRGGAALHRRRSHRRAGKKRYAGHRPLLPRGLRPSLRSLGRFFTQPLLGPG